MKNPNWGVPLNYYLKDGYWCIAGTNTGVPATGPQGPRGPQGDPGVQGIQGEQGDKGDIGAPGGIVPSGILVTPLNYTELGVTDADTVEGNKIYAIANNTTEYVLNLPDFRYNGILIDFSYSGASDTGRTQIFSNYANSWSRVKWGSTWGAWVNSSPSSQIYINSYNYNQYNDIRSLKTNYVYVIGTDITEEMVSNLPHYGIYGILYKIDMDYDSSDDHSGEMIIYMTNNRLYYQTKIGTSYTDWNVANSVYPRIIGKNGNLYGYSDFDDFENGDYYIYTPGTSIANSPTVTTLAGVLSCYVIEEVGYQLFKQHGSTSLNGRSYERNKWNGVWGAWYPVGDFGFNISSNASVSALGLPNNLDLFIDNGIYVINNSVTSEGISNMPTYGALGVLTVETYSPFGGTGVKQTFVDSRNCIWTRMKYNSNWYDWICSTETGAGYFINTCIEKPININSSSHILAFGDSITANSGLTLAEGWVPILASKFGCDYTNKAVSGARFDELNVNSIKAQYESVTNWEDITHVFLAAGVNDANYLTNQVSFKTYVQNAIDYIQAHTNAKIIVITPVERAAASYKTIQYASIINAVAHAKDCSIINGQDFPIPFRTTGYYDNMMQDGIHPTALGQKVYAKYVMNCIM